MIRARKPYLCIPLRGKRGGITKVSECAWQLADGHYWYQSKTGYATSMKAGYLHRRLMAAELPEVVDHHNCDRLDNRYENIKSVTEAYNKNRVSKKKTPWPYKGVRKIYKKWTARMTVKGKSIHIGYFDTAEEAALAYDQEARKLGRICNFGEAP